MFTKIMIMLGLSPAQSPANDRNRETTGNERAAASADAGRPGKPRDEGLRNAIARGAAAGAAREVMRTVLEEISN